MLTKKIFSLIAALACVALICSCASNELKPEPDYNKARADAQSAYQEIDD